MLSAEIPYLGRTGVPHFIRVSTPERSTTARIVAVTKFIHRHDQYHLQCDRLVCPHGAPDFLGHSIGLG